MNNKDRASNAIKWIDSLAVTEAAQGCSQLGDAVSGNCCLGYGCHILGIDYEASYPIEPAFSNSVGLHGDYGQTAARVNDIIDYIGCLALMNDEGYTFAEIAKVLRTKPYRFFKARVAKLIKDNYREVSV